MQTTTKETAARGPKTETEGPSAGDDHLAVQEMSDTLADPLTDPLQHSADATPAVETPAVDHTAAAPDATSADEDGEAARAAATEAAMGERREWFDKLLKLHKKLGRLDGFTRDQASTHGSMARAGGASSDASADYHREYAALNAKIKTTTTIITKAILEVSDGRGNVLERIDPAYYRQTYTQMLAKVVDIEVDMQMHRTAGRHDIEVRNAEDAIAAAEQMRKILKKSSVMLLKAGAIALGCPPELADTLSKHYSAWLDTLDVAVGDRWILQGRDTTPEELKTIYLAQLMKLAVDECHSKFIGKFLEHDITQKICDSLGANMFADVIKGTIDLAFVKWGPTLTPSPDNILKALEQSMAAKAQDMQDRMSFDWTNQGFVNWLTDTSIDAMDYALTEAAKKKGGRS